MTTRTKPDSTDPHAAINSALVYERSVTDTTSATEAVDVMRCWKQADGTR